MTTSGKAKLTISAQRIAAAFYVTVAEVEQWHSQGFGYSEIGKAYALAAASGIPVDQLLARHQAGEGWRMMAHSLERQVLGGNANAHIMTWKHAGSR